MGIAGYRRNPGRKQFQTLSLYFLRVCEVLKEPTLDTNLHFIWMVAIVATYRSLTSSVPFPVYSPRSLANENLCSDTLDQLE
jgi:hypothetical protein